MKVSGNQAAECSWNMGWGRKEDGQAVWAHMAKGQGLDLRSPGLLRGSPNFPESLNFFKAICLAAPTQVSQWQAPPSPQWNDPQGEPAQPSR